MSEASQAALAVLRDPSRFQWYLIPLFVIVIYIYANEIEKRNFSAVCAGLAFYGMDLFNEIWNALVLQFTGKSAVWTAPGQTAYLIFVGLNIETSLMFAILGIAFVKMLPKDRKARVLGLPNRWFFAVFNSILCVGVELILNRAGVLVWYYRWWNWPRIWLIILIGYLPFMVVSFWVYDMEKIRSKLAALIALYAVDFSAIIALAVILNWI